MTSNISSKLQMPVSKNCGKDEQHNQHNQHTMSSQHPQVQQLLLPKYLRATFTATGHLRAARSLQCDYCFLSVALSWSLCWACLAICAARAPRAEPAHHPRFLHSSGRWKSSDLQSETLFFGTRSFHDRLPGMGLKKACCHMSPDTRRCEPP